MVQTWQPKHNVSVYTSKECSMCCLFFFFAHLNLSSLLSHLWTCPFLKQIRAAHVCHGWSSLHFPRIQKEAVISLKTFKTKSAKGESLLDDFAPISLLISKRIIVYSLFHCIATYLGFFFFCLDGCRFMFGTCRTCSDSQMVTSHGRVECRQL